MDMTVTVVATVEAPQALLHSPSSEPALLPTGEPEPQLPEPVSAAPDVAATPVALPEDTGRTVMVVVVVEEMVV